MDNSDQPSTCINSTREWFTKYFLEGQHLDPDLHAKQNLVPHAERSWFDRNRKILSVAIPAVIAHVIWWSYMGSNNLFHLFTGSSVSSTAPRYLMSITMAFGSMIAGATSEGGASVAFPVMTLIFGIPPPVARDFSFMIQSAGMTAAAFTILVMRVRIEWHALFYGIIGGTAGLIFGLEQVAPRLEPPYSKMYFVVIWFAFAFSLFWLNRMFGRKVYDEIPYWSKGFIGPRYTVNISRQVTDDGTGATARSIEAHMSWRMNNNGNGVGNRSSHGADAAAGRVEMVTLRGGGGSGGSGAVVRPAENTTNSDSDSGSDSGSESDVTGNGRGGIEDGADGANGVVGVGAPVTRSLTFGFNWKALVLLGFGFLGGIFTAMSGSGIDICSFACLTLLFRVSEKIATPTSVVLMATNTVVGFLYREFGMGGVEHEAWGYLAVCIPIVVLGAPLGSMVGSHFHRLVLAAFVYVTDTVQLVGALYVVRPWTTQKTQTPLHLCITSVAIVVAGAIFFKALAYWGGRLLDMQDGWEEAEREAYKRALGEGMDSTLESKDDKEENAGAGTGADSAGKDGMKKPMSAKNLGSSDAV